MTTTVEKILDQILVVERAQKKLTQLRDQFAKEELERRAAEELKKASS